MGTMPAIKNTTQGTAIGAALVSGSGFIPGVLNYYGGAIIYIMVASSITDNEGIIFGATFSYEI